MSEAGEAITTLRERYVGELVRGVAHVSTELLPELGSTAMQFVPGWRRDEMPLRDALLLSRERDRAARFTTTGPHRADWIVQHEGRPYQEALSRGQAKLIALACVLAQAEHYAGVLGEWPIVLLDDVASELDRTHQAAALNYVLSAGAQVFATATQSLDPQLHARHDVTTFHVEQGRVTAAT